MSTNYEGVEYITIIGKSFDEVAEECRAQKLGDQQFSIVGPIQRHRFMMAGQSARDATVHGQNLISATFARSVRR